ncbi:MAG TPA: Uma2 family endonuclease [Thermomicrobiales bacterium]|nr:Uma2 family endonuclease [Thermomicrobiales bacterium]
MATTGKVTTADDLLRLPEDGQRHELIAGELHTMAPSGGEHGGITGRLTIRLGYYVVTHQLGEVFAAETGFLLTTNPDTVLAPDAAFIANERLGADWVKGYWPGPPDLAVEVISPGDLYTEVEKKVATWLAHGARMVIVLNPRRRTVTVHRSPTEVRHLTENDVLDGEDVVPGWTMLVRDLFALRK